MTISRQRRRRPLFARVFAAATLLSALFLIPAIQAADSRAEALRQAEHARLEAIVSADGGALDGLFGTAPA